MSELFFRVAAKSICGLLFYSTRGLLGPTLHDHSVCMHSTAQRLHTVHLLDKSLYFDVIFSV